jgi:hypothetical protein
MLQDHRMSPHQVIAVALRVFAVWLAVWVLSTLPGLSFAARGDAPAWRFALVFVALVGVLILALWFFPRTIAEKLLSPPLAEPTTSRSSDTWLAMGCALIGLSILTTALPRLVMQMFALYQAASDIAYSDTGGLKSWAIYYVVEVAIAVWLILGARGFRRLFWWARNAGLSKSPDPPQG